MARSALALALLLAAAPAGAQSPPAGPRAAEPPASPQVPKEPPTAAPATPAPAPAAEAPAPGASEPAPSAKPVLPRGAILEELSGTVRAVDRKAHTLAVDTPSGGVTLALDRNTMVYTAAGLGTVLDVKPGAQIRAGRNADFLAYWVQVRTAPSTAAPQSTPGQGTGPAGGGAAPASESSGPGAGPPPAAPTTGPSGVPPGGAGGAPPGG